MLRQLLGSPIGCLGRTCRDWVRDRSGATAVEFALVGPPLLMMLFGIVGFGLTLNNYLELTDGVRSGARAFAIGRSTASPYTVATNAIYGSAVSLTQASITVTLKVNGTTCATDSACSTALNAAPGGAASVTATYPCSINIMGIDYAPSCTLTSQTTNLIE